MKLADIGLFTIDGKFCLCRKNSRGLPQSGGVDVTNQVIDFFLDNFQTKEDQFYVSTRGPEMFKVQIHKMSEEEKQEHLKRKEAEKRDLLIKLTTATLLYENAYKGVTK